MTRWTLERITELTARRVNRESFSSIAFAMGFTRSAIAGKCKRLGLCDTTAPQAFNRKGKTKVRPAYSRPILDVAFEDLRK